MKIPVCALVNETRLKPYCIFCHLVLSRLALTQPVDWKLKEPVMLKAV